MVDLQVGLPVRSDVGLEVNSKVGRHNGDGRME